MGIDRIGRAGAGAALAASLALGLAACMDDSPELAGTFAEVTSEPTGVPMPDSGMREAMPTPGV